MNNSKLKIQTLGFDPNWICVIHDILDFNLDKKFELEVFPNMEMKIKAHDRLKTVPFRIKEKLKIQREHTILFGVTHPKNKYYVYHDFLTSLRVVDYDNIVSDSSIVSGSSLLSGGVFIDHQSSISSQTQIGFGVTIKRGAHVGHHNRIGDFTDINPGVITSGNVIIGAGCVIGAGAMVKNNVIIGENTMIGMGSVVTKNIPPNSIAYGNPCRVVEQNRAWSIDV